MLVISHARCTGLYEYQRLWLEATERFGKPMQIRGKGFTAIVIDDVEACPRNTRRRLAADTARRLRPALRMASARSRPHGAP